MKKVQLLGLFILLIMFFPLLTKAEQIVTYDENGVKTVSNSKIFRTITAYDFQGNPVDSASFEVTEEQYLNNTTTPAEYAFIRQTSLARGNVATHKKKKKRLTLSVQPTGVSIQQKHISIELEWLTMPNVRLYDIIGWTLVSGGWTVGPESTFRVRQIYDNNQTITYTNGSQNRVTTLHGDGLVMNLVNDATNSLKVTYDYDIIVSSQDFTINASYQHATSTSITTSEAKSATYGNSTSNSNYMVLGGTFIYSKTIGNKYDRMAGVSVAYDVYDLV